MPSISFVIMSLKPSDLLSSILHTVCPSLRVTFSRSVLCSAFPRGSCLLQTASRPVLLWQRRRRSISVFTVGTPRPSALQQRQQPHGQPVPAAAARLSWGLGPAPAAPAATAATRPGPPAAAVRWRRSAPQPVAPAAAADAQRQPQRQCGGTDHGTGGQEPLAVPQPAGGGVSPATASAQVSSTLVLTNEKGWSKMLALMAPHHANCYSITMEI